MDQPTQSLAFVSIDYFAFIKYNSPPLRPAGLAPSFITKEKSTAIEMTRSQLEGVVRRFLSTRAAFTAVM